MPTTIQVPPVVHLTTHHPKAWALSSTLAESPTSSRGLVTPSIQPISRHDSLKDARTSSEVPPPYVMEQGLPAYTPVHGLSRAATTLRYLFWFGFSAYYSCGSRIEGLTMTSSIPSPLDHWRIHIIIFPQNAVAIVTDWLDFCEK